MVNENSDKIVVQTGNTGLQGTSSDSGNPFGEKACQSNGGAYTSLPYRLIVTCLD